MTEPVLTCPECGSDRVTTAHIQTFMVNTGEHFCHSVKTHDSDSSLIGHTTVKWRLLLTMLRVTEKHCGKLSTMPASKEVRHEQ